MQAATYTKVYYNELFDRYEAVQEQDESYMLVTGPNMGGTGHAIGSQAHCRAQAVWLRLKDYRIIRA